MLAGILKNPVDKWITDLASNPELQGWGIVIFTVITLFATIICAGLVGLEREFHGHAAGLRTHIIIALGASLIMTLSVYAFPLGEGYSRDPARLAAQVVSGIGFIGAGTIMQNGTGIKGLTTAASLWVSGGLGLACGCGYVLEGLIASIAITSVLYLMVFVEKMTSKKDPHIVLILDSSTPALHVALEIAEKYAISVKDIKSSLVRYRTMDCLKMVITLQRSSKLHLLTFADELRQRVTPYDLTISYLKND